MTTLQAQLEDQLKAALKAKDTKTANLIRMIDSKVAERQTAPGFSGVVDDALVLDAIADYKQLIVEARVTYAADSARFQDQLAQADFEVAWCSNILVLHGNVAELRAVIAKVVTTLPAKDPKFASVVVLKIREQFGSGVDATLVKKLATEVLSS